MSGFGKWFPRVVGGASTDACLWEGLTFEVF